jgi:O-antigen ligase
MAEAISTTWWESKFALRLQLLLAIGAMAVVCRVAFEEDISWILWFTVGLVVACISLVRWPYGALFILIAASVMPRISVGLFGWNARPEHFAAAIVGFWTCLWLILRNERIRLNSLDYWVLAYILLNYVSSAFGSTEPSTTLRWALQNNLAVASYFLVRFLVSDSRTFRNALRILMAIGIAEAVYGLLCYGSHLLFGTLVGVEPGAYLFDVAAPFGTMYEPNLFGAYTACFAVLFLALFLTAAQNRSAYLIGFIITSFAALASYSRAVLLAFILAIAWVLWNTRHSRGQNPKRLAVLIVGLGLLFAVAIGGVLRERLSNLYNQGFSDNSALGRLIVTQQAIQELPGHLILGRGTASFNLSFDWGKYIPEWTSEKTWIGNAPLRILHDTGLIGEAAFIGFLVSLWVKIRRRFRAPGRPVPLLFALSAGAVVYVITFQSTDGTILSFFWVYLGFMASAAILMSDSTVALHDEASSAESSTHTN